MHFFFEACAWNITDWDTCIIRSRSTACFQIYLLKTKLILHIESGWRVCPVWSLLASWKRDISIIWDTATSYSVILWPNAMSFLVSLLIYESIDLFFFFVVLPCAFFCHFSWRTWCTIERVTTTRSCCVISTCPGLRMAQSPSPAGHPSTWVLIYHMISFMFSFSFYLFVLVCKVLTFTSFFGHISCQLLKWWLVIAMEDQSIVGRWGSLCTSCKWHSIDLSAIFIIFMFGSLKQGFVAFCFQKTGQKSWD